MNGFVSCSAMRKNIFFAEFRNANYRIRTVNIALEGGVKASGVLPLSFARKEN
jgi:hypothetical protein